MPKAKTPQEQKISAEKVSAQRAANRAKNPVPSPQSGSDEAQKGSSVVTTSTELAQNDNPQPSTSNARAVNKPMTDYTTSDGTPIRRNATEEEVVEHKVPDDEEPRRLVIGDGPGNLMVIKWDRGGGQIPKNCWGGWNNKMRAQEAIHAARGCVDFKGTQVETQALG